MKKVIIVMFALITMLTVNGQEEGIRFGAKAGLNFARITGDDLEGFDSKTGFHVGGLIEIPIVEKIAVQAEVLFSSQGAEENEFGFE